MSRIPSRPLVAGTSTTRTLRGAETHRYTLPLTTNQVVEIVVSPRDIDLVVSLTSPDKAAPLRVDLAADPMTTERVVAITEATGRHQVEVTAPNAQAATGAYTIRVAVMRSATDRDRARVQARRTLEEGARLRAAIGGPAGSLDAAEAKLQEALVELRATADGAGVADALFMLAGIAAERAAANTVDRARDALDAYREQRDRVGMSRASQMLGQAQERRGERLAAQAALTESLTLAQEVESRALQARTRLSLSTLYSRSGDAERGIAQAREARRLYHELRMPTWEAYALNNMGLAASDLGDDALALTYFDEALRIARALGDRSGEANLLNNLGNLYRQVGAYQKALASHADALALARAVKNEDNEARALNTLGMTYRRLGDYRKALDYHEQSLAIRRRRSGDQAALASTLDGMGRTFHALGDDDRALAALNEALAIRQRLGERYNETDALRQLAIVERDRGHLEAALRHVEASVALTDTLRRTMISPDRRASYVAAQQEQYELHVDVLMQLHRQRPAEGFSARALEASERGRVRVLLESLDATLRLDDPAQNGDPRLALLTQPRTLSASAIQRELLEPDTILLEFTLGEPRSWLWAVSPDTIASFELPPRAAIETSVRRLYALLTARQPRANESARDRAARLAEADAAWRTEAATFSRTLFGPVVAQLGEAWHGKRLLIVGAGVLEYLPFAALPDPAVDADIVASAAAAAAPASTSRSTSALTISAAARGGAPAVTAPAATAATGGLTPLVANHEIVTLPSASVLALLRQEAGTRATPPKQLAVLADPVFEVADPRVRRSGRRPAPPLSPRGSLSSSPQGTGTGAVRPAGLQRRLARLPFSRQEAQAIAAFVPDAARFQAIDFQASRALATSAGLGDYRIVHFATHGWFDSERPDQSGLAFSSVSRDGAAQDGILHLRDIYRLRLPVEIVVLSACQTALGKEIKGEGLIGLTRGFMHAGALRVVASLWQVDDLATAELMRLFYRGMLQDGLRPAAALRAAQRELSTQARWASPYYWSAFVLQGEWK